MIIHKVEERRCTRRRVPSSFSHKEEIRPLCGATQEKQRGRTPYASLFSIHLWIPRVLIVQRKKGHHNRTQVCFLVISCILYHLPIV
ncbi:hypothetical protein [Aneurinibacillus aneurinilyticus]|uniref:hypothetical protein n=1 Tax=Aneurinibacillus aneurinilyticus TaxID=1391 RepID=UPI0035249619